MAVGLFGGTFDPIHYGHLKIASEMLRLLDLSELRFIPCALPSHKNLPSVSATDRAAMLELAIEDESRFLCDRREINRGGPSFTIDTLAEIRQEFGPHLSLIFLMGSDSLCTIDTWKQWRKLLTYTHLCIVERPGASVEFSSDIWRWVKRHRVSDPTYMNSTPNGYIFITVANALEISATEVRRQLSSGLPLANRILPHSVLDFVKQNNLYIKKINDESRESSCVKEPTSSP